MEGKERGIEQGQICSILNTESFGQQTISALDEGEIERERQRDTAIEREIFRKRKRHGETERQTHGET